MYLVFDTETTGLPFSRSAPASKVNNWPRMVQLAWVLYDEYEQIAKQSNDIIKPEGFAIPSDAVRIHGITTRKANACGVPILDVLDTFADVVNESNAVIAHNFDFDRKVLDAEFVRSKRKMKWGRRRKVCTKEIGTNYCKIPGRYGYKWPTLPELYYKLFGEIPQRSHDALADVHACARCFFALKRRGIIKFKSS